MSKIAYLKPRLAHFLRRQNALDEVALSAIWATGLSVVAIFFPTYSRASQCPWEVDFTESDRCGLDGLSRTRPPRRATHRPAASQEQLPIAAPNLRIPRRARPPRLPSRRRPPSTLARTSWIRWNVDSSATDRASPRQLSHTRSPPPMMARPAVAAAAASPSSTISSTPPPPHFPLDAAPRRQATLSPPRT
ncbi:hypothetical protein C8R45DRAFT_505040 [Mycena sanguinolenta]|nr:hypothetical protein C8R45DRAFT_505040 [Mycena sanguinolenta]